ncbi:MAG: ABC transporter ATP-binding protein [Thermomicrobiales bacterium]|nr:ABC transporter ATP-binding protein [Thermomicrobiales bacterium]
MTAVSSSELPIAASERDWLTVRGVEKSYDARPVPVHALRGVDLTVPEGTLTAILGSSGCGKSTLLKIIAGIERQDRGEVVLAGRLISGDAVHLPPERRDIGIVPQEGALFPHLSVADNIGFGLRSWRGNPISLRARRERVERIDELLALVGLTGYGRRRPDELSGGQQQRVALARALAPSPKAILLDEPFSALDAGLRAELRLEVRDLLRRTTTTAILVTHDQEEALSLADHVAIMRDGLVVQSGSPHEIYTRPADPTVASFVGDAVLLPAVFDGGQDGVAVCELGCVAVCASCRKIGGGPCTLMVRPEQVILDTEGLPARILGFTFYGHDTMLTIGMGEDGAGARVSARVPKGVAPKIGDHVRVRVVGDAIAYADSARGADAGVPLPFSTTPGQGAEVLP